MSGTSVDVPEPVLGALATWLDAHDVQVPGLIEGLYVVGSVAFDDWRPGSDVDIVAFTADPVTDEAGDDLAAAHAAVAAELDRAITVDGPILAWGDVSIPPMPMLRPWTLDGEFHLDGDCFEINPVTWLTLSRHGIAVRGPVVRDLGVAVDADEVRAFVGSNTGTYWRTVGQQLETAAVDWSRETFDAAAVEWCALGVARMLFTHETGDVTSKSHAGELAIVELPDHADVLRLALDIRAGADPAATVERGAVAATARLVTDVVRRIAG